MNTLSYYSRQKEDWSENELTKLKEEYETKQMTISQIADLHKRTPGAISYRLKHIGLIGNSLDARGYPEYKTSSLYKEIVEEGKLEKIEKQIKKEKEIKKHQTQEYLELKNEIATMKTDIKEILRIMQYIYTLDQN